VNSSERPIKDRVTYLINEAGGFGKISGNVIIKPNICSRKSPETGATTDPRIVEAVIVNLVEKGIDASRIIIVESDTAFVNTEKASRTLGYGRLVDKYGVKFANLSKVDATATPGKYYSGEFQIPTLLLRDKYFISVGKMKTHCQENLSCSLKNQYGCLSTRDKVQFHPHLPEVIADLNYIIRPDLALVDGIFSMEGYGPIKGKAVKTNLILCSKDLVALDKVACDIMGIDFRRVGHLQLCKGLGNIENAEVVGADINKLRKKFKQDTLRHMMFVFLNRYLKIPK
jgi:uncharacterized protein (DUF362 family)